MMSYNGYVLQKLLLRNFLIWGACNGNLFSLVIFKIFSYTFLYIFFDFIDCIGLLAFSGNNKDSIDIVQ